MTIRMVKNSRFGKIAKQAGRNKQAGRKYFSDLLNEQAKNLQAHCKPIPVMKTGFSLCTFSHREKPPVFISWDPCNEHRVFPVGKEYTGKSLFWPCTDPVRDCSAGWQKNLKNLSEQALLLGTSEYSYFCFLKQDC